MKALMIICGTVAGLFLAVGLSGLAGRRPPPPEARLISDAHGALSQICIQYRKDFNPSVIETLTDLFNGLADGVGIRVIVEDVREFDFLKKELAQRGVHGLDRLLPVVTGFPITPWARDRFGAMTSSGGIVIAVPPSRSRMPGARGNDELVPEILAASLPGATCRPMPFMFEGGDLLSDEDNAFIAANCMARNSPLDADDRPALLERMRTALNKRIIPIGEAPDDVPDHHICMYLTPLGAGCVAMADPALGVELFLKCGLTGMIDIETEEAQFKPFRNAIRCMEQSGFRVVRVPILLTRTPRVYVSYNNVILEHRKDGKTVYMPVYDIPEIDRAAGEVFETQGWRVVPVRVGKLYGHTGSLRCQVGIIRRESAGGRRD